MNKAQLVSEAYAKKHIAGKCELCGSQDWGISDELDYLTFSRANSDNTLAGLSQCPVVVMTCSNCGNMRFHSLRVLARDCSAQQ